MLANDLKTDDFKVVSLHPGFVATDMGASASSLMSEIRPGKPCHDASCLHYCFMQHQASILLLHTAVNVQLYTVDVLLCRVYLSWDRARHIPDTLHTLRAVLLH